MIPPLRPIAGVGIFFFTSTQCAAAAAAPEGDRRNDVSAEFRPFCALPPPYVCVYKTEKSSPPPLRRDEKRVVK